MKGGDAIALRYKYDLFIFYRAEVIVSLMNDWDGVM